ncbi:hypothetical protein M8C21_013921 [Ambrosia artemisiifolia]|uniref:Uncharacterized protein n=1 Tax=Ambrosia artemisiifolia TaxID=4212 RepID=A0AAD5GZ07_AMBAR|nr:hypothetical protein M8C21_013921 [Ambrosia artemisiifolia]
MDSKTNKSTNKETNRRAWTSEEDEKLTEAIEIHGPKKWNVVAAKAGLRRCGKSCRLRWLNYLRPNIKRGNISDQEEDLIIRLHKLLGNSGVTIGCFSSNMKTDSGDLDLRNAWEDREIDGEKMVEAYWNFSCVGLGLDPGSFFHSGALRQAEVRRPASIGHFVG